MLSSRCFSGTFQGPEIFAEVSENVEPFFSQTKIWSDSQSVRNFKKKKISVCVLWVQISEEEEDDNDFNGDNCDNDSDYYKMFCTQLYWLL